MNLDTCLQIYNIQWGGYDTIIQMQKGIFYVGVLIHMCSVCKGVYIYTIPSDVLPGFRPEGLRC